MMRLFFLLNFAGLFLCGCCSLPGSCIYVAWGDIDTRYSANETPVHCGSDEISIKGWRGERTFAQAVVWAEKRIDKLKFEVTDLKGPKGERIEVENIRSGFVRSVVGDGYFSNGTGCGDWAEQAYRDSIVVADCIDYFADCVSLGPEQQQGIWLTCRIPPDVKSGIYCGKLIVRDGKRVVKRLKINIIAESEILPHPKDWYFHLDLWQNPYSVARYHDVELWSDEHFEAMRPLMTMLADAGQKVITATIIHKPWGGQTYDHFESMVETVRRPDGSWEYDFDIFDSWIEFMMSCGITSQINCYSIAPWNSSFRYFDQSSGTYQYVNADVGTSEYAAFWTPMLMAFADHLREKGWFDICTIAIDERPLDVMLEVIKFIRNVVPGFKISLAGNYHPEIDNDIYDFSVAYLGCFPDGVVERRRKEGKISTYYTCCTEITPNLFTVSDPQDGLFLGLEMMRRKSDGYLRWAYNSWPEDPLTDSRYRMFTSGDTFLVYPGGRSSIRMERLIQGIQEYEKMRLKAINEHY